MRRYSKRTVKAILQSSKPALSKGKLTLQGSYLEVDNVHLGEYPAMV